MSGQSFGVPQGAFYDKAELESASGEYLSMRCYRWAHCVTMIYRNSTLPGEKMGLLMNCSVIFENRLGIANWKLSKRVAPFPWKHTRPIITKLAENTTASLLHAYSNCSQFFKWVLTWLKVVWIGVTFLVKLSYG